MSVAAAASLRVDTHGAVRVLSLDRPRAANALDSVLHEALVSALHEADEVPSIGAVLLTAPPGRAFCAGADLKEYSELPPAEAADRRREQLCRTVLALADLEVPLVALVRGKAVGAGCMLPCLADEILAEPAAAFALPEIGLGMPTALGITVVAARAGRRTAIRLAQLGETLDVEAAHAAGLVDVIVRDADAHAVALERARTLAGNAGAAYAENRRWLNRHLRCEMLRAIRASRRYAERARAAAGGGRSDASRDH